jgi:hypothetical protein
MPECDYCKVISYLWLRRGTPRCASWPGNRWLTERRWRPSSARFLCELARRSDQVAVKLNIAFFISEVSLQFCNLAFRKLPQIKSIRRLRNKLLHFLSHRDSFSVVTAKCRITACDYTYNILQTRLELNIPHRAIVAVSAIVLPAVGCDLPISAFLPPIFLCAVLKV